MTQTHLIIESLRAGRFNMRFTGQSNVKALRRKDGTTYYTVVANKNGCPREGCGYIELTVDDVTFRHDFSSVLWTLKDGEDIPDEFLLLADILKVTGNFFGEMDFPDEQVEVYEARTGKAVGKNYIIVDKPDVKENPEDVFIEE